MPSDRQTRKQRHQAQVKTQTGKAIRGAQATEFVKGSGYRKTEFIGGKKFFTPMSSDPNASGASGDVTNITVTGSTGAGGDVKSDGTVHFTAPQTGVAPTSDLHLATKKYVDDEGVLGANSVTVDKLQQVATDTFLGRDSSGTGNVEVLSLDDVEAMLQLNTYLQSASTNSLTDMTTSNPSAGHYLRYNGTNYVNTTLQVGDISGLQASQIPALATSKITSGTFADARISQGSVTQHIAAIKSTGSFMTGFDLHPDIAVTDQQIIKIVTQQGSYGTGTVSTSGNVHTITLNAQDTNTNTNQLTTFTLTADSGSNQTIAHGNTLDIEGGSAISTVVGSTDKVTINATGNLPTLAGLSATTGNFIVGSSGTFTVQSGATARASLGLGSAATQNTSAFLASDATGASTWTVSGNLTGNDLYVTTGYHRTNASGGLMSLTNSGAANGVQAKWLYLDTTYGAGGLSNGEIRCSLGRIGSSVAIPTNGKFIVGGVCNSSSSAIAQFAGFVRMRDYMIIHDGSSSSNAVGWRYGNGGLQTFSEGSGTQNIYAGADVVAYYSSDPRLKTNKKRIEKPLTLLSKINGYTFDWKKYASKFGSHLIGKDYGVMADEIEEVMPELVHDRDNGYKGVKYEKIVPLLIECIKEQQIQIDQLKKWKENKKWI